MEVLGRERTNDHRCGHSPGLAKTRWARPWPQKSGETVDNMQCETHDAAVVDSVWHGRRWNQVGRRGKVGGGMMRQEAPRGAREGEHLSLIHI